MFTRKELEIIKQIKYKKLLSIEEIAKHNFIEKATAKTHLHHIRIKMRCRSMAELVWELFHYDEEKK